jgi:hypothetical protein
LKLGKALGASLAPAILDRKIAAFDPPSSRIRCTKAAVHWLCAAAVPVPSNPRVAGFACCARAASGHAAAAPPSAAKNFRRSMWLAM